MRAWVIYLEDKLFCLVQAAPDEQSAIRAAAQVYGIIDPKEQMLLNAQPFRTALAERAAMPSLFPL